VLNVVNKVHFVHLADGLHHKAVLLDAAGARQHQQEKTMTEAEWLAATDPLPMLLHLGDRASLRQVRLYACAWGYASWDRLTDERSRQAIVTAERFADGLADSAELGLAFTAAAQAWNEIPEVRGTRRVRGNKALTGARTARRTAELARDVASLDGIGRTARYLSLRGSAAMRLTLANFLRDIFGIPGRPVAVEPAWLAWQGGTVRRLAESIYAEGAFDDLSVLGDALEEAGCTSADVLGHCRQPEQHVRGCWLIDLLVEKG
jgi:hypothetical protein